MKRQFSIVALGTLCACSSAAPPPKARPPAPVLAAESETRPKPPERETPPEPGTRRERRVGPATWTELSNGLRGATIENRSLPLVEIRFVVQGGRAEDGEKPGLVALTSQMLKEGGGARFEALGTSLGVEMTAD